MDGIETARCLRAADPDLVIVLISLEDPASISPAAADCGAATFVRKQDFGPAALRRVWGAYG
jgi:DNA-binding NarL/FixJ family response regulator